MDDASELQELESALSTVQDGLARAQLEAQLSRELARLDPVRAIQLSGCAIQTAEKLNDPQTVALALRGLAEARRQRLENPLVLDALGRALEIYTKLKDEQGQLACLTGIGAAYTQDRQYDQALEYLDRALLLSASVGDQWLEAQILNSLGLVYHQLGDFKRALDITEQSLAKVNVIERPFAYAMRLLNIGWLWFDLNQHEHTDSIFKRVLEIARLEKESHLEAGALIGLAESKVRSGDLDKALALLIQARDLARCHNDISRELEALTALAQLWQQNDPILAGTALERTLDLYVSQGNWAAVAHTYLWLSQLRESIGDFSGALEQYKRYHHANLRQHDEITMQREKPLEVRLDAHKASQLVAGLRVQASELLTLLSQLESRTADLLRATSPKTIENLPEVLLTQRELEVLRLVSQGHSNKSVAKILGISSHTVSFHLSAACRKFGVRGRAQATAAATRRGWLG